MECWTKLLTLFVVLPATVFTLPTPSPQTTLPGTTLPGTTTSTSGENTCCALVPLIVSELVTEDDNSVAGGLLNSLVGICRTGGGGSNPNGNNNCSVCNCNGSCGGGTTPVGNNPGGNQLDCPLLLEILRRLINIDNVNGGILGNVVSAVLGKCGSSGGGNIPGGTNPCGNNTGGNNPGGNQLDCPLLLEILRRLINIDNVDGGILGNVVSAVLGECGSSGGGNIPGGTNPCGNNTGGNNPGGNQLDCPLLLEILRRLINIDNVDGGILGNVVSAVLGKCGSSGGGNIPGGTNPCGNNTGGNNPGGNQLDCPLLLEILRRLINIDNVDGGILGNVVSAVLGKCGSSGGGNIPGGTNPCVNNPCGNNPCGNNPGGNNPGGNQPDCPLLLEILRRLINIDNVDGGILGNVVSAVLGKCGSSGGGNIPGGTNPCGNNPCGNNPCGNNPGGNNSGGNQPDCPLLLEILRRLINIDNVDGGILGNVVSAVLGKCGSSGGGNIPGGTNPCGNNPCGNNPCGNNPCGNNPGGNNPGGNQPNCPLLLQALNRLINTDNVDGGILGNVVSAVLGECGSSGGGNIPGLPNPGGNNPCGNNPCGKNPCGNNPCRNIPDCVLLRKLLCQLLSSKNPDFDLINKLIQVVLEFCNNNGCSGVDCDNCKLLKDVLYFILSQSTVDPTLLNKILVRLLCECEGKPCPGGQADADTCCLLLRYLTLLLTGEQEIDRMLLNKILYAIICECGGNECLRPCKGQGETCYLLQNVFLLLLKSGKEIDRCLFNGLLAAIMSECGGCLNNCLPELVPLMNDYQMNSGSCVQNPCDENYIRFSMIK